MQISLRQAEIEKAVVEYIADQGITIAHKEITVGFTAGRGASGISAEISIEPLGSSFIAEAQKSVEQGTTVLEPTEVVEGEETKPEKAAGKTVGSLFS